MTRTQTLIGFFATGLLLVSLGMLILREPTLQARAVDAQLAESIAHGTDIYLENCVICHGASGEGLAAYPALNIASGMDQTTLENVIERGRYGTQMAAYGIDEGGILSAADVDALVALVQSGDWQAVYAQASANDQIPPELVIAEVPEEMLVSVAALPDGERLTLGLTLYAENCASCHGADLNGTTLAPALNTDEIRATESYELVRVVEQGVPGTLMAAWDAALDDQQVDGLVSLMLNWPSIEAAGVAIPVVEAEPIDMSPEAIARGEHLFDIACTACHGTDGYGTPMAPALNNLLFLNDTSDAAMRQIIAMGVNGTTMPAWGSRLSEAQINDLISYLRSNAATAPIISTWR